MRIPQWGHLCTTGETNDFAKTVGLRLASLISNEAIKQPLSTLVERGDFVALCDFPVDYSRLTCSDAALLRQVLSLYTKRKDLDLGADKEQVAYKKFQEAELLCSETNTLFKAWQRGHFQFAPDVEAVLYRAQRKIANLLGDVPSFSDLRMRFGPGATTQIKRVESSVKRKLSAAFACSEDLAPYVANVLEEVPAWIPFNEDSESVTVAVEIHPGRLSFVPKDAKTFRTIVVEPALNGFLQAGYGDFIAERLRRVGIDIRDQSRNQQLAKEASLSGALATLDLSSASDTIATELVYHLLPYDWALALDRARTSCVAYKGSLLKLQKFSSMGNGFTFPLETLIFWALAKSTAIRGGTVSVYGDDIILPTADVELFSRVLRSCGFLLNDAKSFSSGQFRESCGHDYFSGIDIRPFYLRDRISGESLFSMHNFFVRKGNPDIAELIRSYLDPSFQIWGPDGYGDGHLLGPWVPLPHRRTLPKNPRVSGGWGGYTFETFSWRARLDKQRRAGDHVVPTYCAYVSEGKPSLASASSLQAYLSLSDRPTRISKDGVPILSLPGTQMYRRITIYTFDPDGVSHL